MRKVWSLGWGKPSGLFLVGKVPEQQLEGDSEPSTWKVLGSVILANLPQLYLTFVYYFWNSHLKVMLAAREYSAFAVKDDHAKNGPLIVEREDEEESQQASAELQPEYLQVALSEEDAEVVAETKEPVEQCLELRGSKRGLRVTFPSKAEGQKQRSTRFVTMPLGYWLVNTSVQVALHVCLSQAFFFTRVDVLDHWEEPTKDSISQVGYSVLGLISLVAVALFTFAINIYISLRKFDNRMPLAATCSGALSAACHPQNVHERHHEREVHWGVEEVRVDNDNVAAEGIRTRPLSLSDLDEMRTNPPRCTFTSWEATYAIKG